MANLDDLIKEGKELDRQYKGALTVAMQSKDEGAIKKLFEINQNRLVVKKKLKRLRGF